MEMARALVSRCNDPALALRAAETLISENFAMNPTDSQFWHKVAEVLRHEMEVSK
jgi:hypothetical protein